MSTLYCQPQVGYYILITNNNNKLLCMYTYYLVISCSSDLTIFSVLPVLTLTISKHQGWKIDNILGEQ